MSLKGYAGKPQNRSSLFVDCVKPGMGLEGRGRRLRPLPRPAMVRPAQADQHGWLHLQPDALEYAEFGFLHLLGRFRVAESHRLGA